MQYVLTALLLLVSTSGFSAPLTARDLTIAKPRGGYYLFIAGTTARQFERDQLETAAMWEVVKALHTYKTFLSETTLNRCYSTLGLSVPMTRIQVQPPYFGALFLASGGVWQVPPQGRNYQTDWSCLFAIRENLRTLARTSGPVAAALRRDPWTREVLNLADDLQSKLYEHDPDDDLQVDYDRDDDHPLTTKGNPFPPCGGRDGCVNLDAVITAHHCDVYSTNCPESVGAALARYEAGCGDDPECQWFRHLPTFGPLTDPDWTAGEALAWKQVTHVDMHAWGEGEKAGNRRVVLFHARRHQHGHICRAIGTDDRLRVVFPDEALPAQKYAASFGGVQSCREVLPALVAKYEL